MPKREDPVLITFTDPKSPVSEAFRLVRANLMFANVGGELRSLLFTSAGPREGKSTTTANLGVALAQAGLRVVIVDCDLRKPIQHRVFNLPNKLGVTNYLVGSYALEDVLMETKVQGLWVITSGPLPPNPSELLGSDRMKAFKEALCEKFDMVLFDSPPVVAVSDASVLSAQVDGVILVIRAGQAKIDMIKESKIMLEKANARLIGTILNSFKINGHKYYQYYYYYGGDSEKKSH
ncbi:MAG: CpsD/CapB family tyrosine-protein kinase [Bacillota bacterium]